MTVISISRVLSNEVKGIKLKDVLLDTSRPFC